MKVLTDHKKSTAIQPRDIEQIFPSLQHSCGIDFSLYKFPTLKRAIQKRMHHLNIKTLTNYVDYLKKNPKEAEDISKSMLIRVTQFFRDPEIFKILRKKVFPQPLKRKGQDPIRIWVPGCCTGEEVYSLAIALIEFLNRKNVPIQFFGTDLSEESLNKARSGIYDKKDLQGLNTKYLNRYFKKVGDQYQIDKTIRSMCTFARQNLTQDPPFSKLDLVSCRNVLIYLKPEIQEKIIKIFHYALNTHGFLVLGKSEHIGTLHPTLFDLIDKNHSVYAKKNASVKPEIAFRFNLPELKNLPDLKTFTNSSQGFDITREMDRVLIERTGHAAVLVNDADEIIQTRGDISPYFRFPSRRMSFDVMKMAKDDLAIELKMLLQKAKKQSGAFHKRIETDRGPISVEIQPLHKSLLKEKYFLILFTPVKGEVSVVPVKEPLASDKHQKVYYLRQELAAMKAWMQNMIEEHENTIQELKSTHEEVLSSNEELQSLNEELQTAKEELESTNEELTTVNEQLQSQNEALRQSEERFRILVESVKDYAIFRLDLQGRVVTWNIGAERIKGYKAEEIIGSHFSKFYPHEDQEKPAKKLRLAIRNGVYKEEGWRVRKDGSRFWSNVVITALKDKSGELAGFAKVTRDMTERKIAEELLRKNEQYTRSIIETSNDAYVSADSHGVITEWNHRAEMIFGWKHKDAIGRTLHETIIPERLRQAHLKGMDRFLKTGDGPVLHKTIELVALHRNGHEFPVELTIWPITFDDRVNFHSFIRDITERKKTEQALKNSYDELDQRVKERTKELQLYSEELIRSNADLQQFAYVASHDLQEPLRIVSLYVDLLRKHLKDNLSPEVTEYFRFLQEGALRAQRLIRELLEYSRIGAKDAPFVQVQMEEVLKHVLSLMNVAIQETDANISHDPLPSVLADRFQMEQLLQNLISNAIKYRTKAPPQIHISANQQKSEWLFKAKDNGIGIESQYKDTIFTIFKRLHSTKDYPGTGIGLALCKKIIEGHGGKIWVESALGRGSTFLFTLPVKT